MAQVGAPGKVSALLVFLLVFPGVFRVFFSWWSYCVYIYIYIHTHTSRLLPVCLGGESFAKMDLRLLVLFRLLLKVCWFRKFPGMKFPLVTLAASKSHGFLCWFVLNEDEFVDSGRSSWQEKKIPGCPRVTGGFLSLVAPGALGTLTFFCRKKYLCHSQQVR